MDIIHALEQAIQDPWTLMFLAVWVVGYFMKTYTALDAAKIPWVLVPVGIGLGLWVIDLSLGGAVAGAVIALTQMGAYDAIQPLLKKR